MKGIICISLLLILTVQTSFAFNASEALNFTLKQCTKLYKTLGPKDGFPNNGNLLSEKWILTNVTRWEANFYPGILWYLFKFTKDDHWKNLAIQNTNRFYNDRLLKTTHDIGFMMVNTYGKGYDLTKNSSYPNVIITAAHSLSTRFNAKIGCTRSWNRPASQGFLVIVDNMMNLELLFKAWQLSGNKTFYDMAVSHANKTLKEHVRSNGSSFHVVSFNETTGKVIKKFTAQGYADWSTWSRGQSWLVAGFTIAYRYTKLEHFLKAAEKVSKYYIDNLPDDYIAYFDFDVPHGKNDSYAPRDTSSSSIAASGLLELYSFTKKIQYLVAATKILESLSSPKYRADGKPLYKLPALLANGTRAYKKDYDMAFSFGDYYYVKSLDYFLK